MTVSPKIAGPLVGLFCVLILALLGQWLVVALALGVCCLALAPAVARAQKRAKELRSAASATAPIAAALFGLLFILFN